MSRTITGRTVVAGVAGNPVDHSLSPLIHNAWLEAAGIDGVYVAFAPGADRFDRFVEGMRGGAVRGVNVTIPFKEVALSMADEASARARGAAAANLLIFERDGTVVADNTDGVGLIAALKAQAPGFDPAAGPIAILGAGGAARGAASALLTAGCPQVRIVNRTLAKAEAVAGALQGSVVACPLAAAAKAFDGVTAVINATSAGLSGTESLDVPLDATPATAVVMDMVYKPLLTPFLAEARRLGRPTVDGLEMLVRQAVPSFEAFFGRAPPTEVDVRAVALKALEA
ncbi:shikimate dehydrogenase [Phenylobacterium sp.]|uniref:shikimate dehydrogenase n=1 Tax=Phenylobacterium sp. TaxID=1871053 RepID=UPI002C2F8BC6|nr:shikimate dehydrogenase [Phenylobacterium sp.]HVI31779.1 shikimate dehydrogenase [Phenylobacterium sp.]